MGKQNNAAADSVNASVSKIDATDAYQISTRGEAKKGSKVTFVTTSTVNCPT
jgi:hypothetical protein